MIGTLHVDDANKALPRVLDMLDTYGIRHTAASAANQRPTIEWPGTFVTEYSRPDRCVLFDTLRDCNPFFHYLESMWILAGRNDVRFLTALLPKFTDYTDDGKVFHGAYGYRLRTAFRVDQIKKAVRMLDKAPTTRQVVMSIWHPRLDLSTPSKDIPCNDMLMLKIRDDKLNVTVNNRSNDAVWGAYGANLVQFSFLAMYMAAYLDIPVGRYTQVSDSMHVYEDTPYWRSFLALPREEALKIGSDWWGAYDQLGSAGNTDFSPFRDTNMLDFDADLKTLFAYIDKELDQGDTGIFGPWAMPALHTRAAQDAYEMWRAIRAHKNHRYDEAGDYINRIRAPDWHIACSSWFNRRMQKRAALRADT